MISENEADIFLQSIASLLSTGHIEEGKYQFLYKASELPEAMRLEGLGNIAFYERDLQNAINYYEAAIELNPGRVLARYQYLVGTQIERTGDLVGAFQRYQASIEADRSFLDAYIELGGLLVKVKDYDGAAQCYRDAARLAPSDPIGLLNLKAVLSQLVHQDFSRYGAELKEVEASLGEIKDSNPPTGHAW